MGIYSIFDNRESQSIGRMFRIMSKRTGRPYVKRNKRKFIMSNSVSDKNYNKDIHRDIFGNKVDIGDIISFSLNNRLVTGVVYKYNPKSFGVVTNSNYPDWNRHNQVVKIDMSLNKDVSQKFDKLIVIRDKVLSNELS